jgi:hypothetical protein
MARAASFVRRHPVGVAATALSLVVMLPLLAPGFVLTYDMVFVPRPRLTKALLGISATLPRSVPTAGIVAVASRALTGEIVQKLALLGIILAGAVGASRLVRGARPVARIGAGVLYVWTPMMYERLLLGQWAFLLGYALLPFAISAALAFREGRPGAAWPLALALAATMAASPYTGLFGVAIAAAVALWPRGAVPGLARRAVVLAGVAVVVNLPWVVPALLHPAVPDRPAVAVGAFQARSDSPLGAVGSVLTLGGLWRPDLAPPGRETVAWIPAFVIIAGIGALGLRELRRRWPAGAADGLAAVAGLGVFLAVASSVPGLRAAPLFLVRHLPGGGVFRDAQKFIAPLVLLLAVAFGHGLERLHPLKRSRGAEAGFALLALLPVALAPTLAWAAGGKLFTTSYPASWNRAERIMAADPAPGAVLLLPWHAYVPLSWNRGRPVLEPGADYFSRRAVADGSLVVGPFVLPAEDPWSRLAAPSVQGSGPLSPELRRIGIRYVVLLKEADWRSFRSRIRGRPILETDDLSLYRGPPPSRIPRFDDVPAAAVVVADVVTAAFLVVAAVGAVRERRRAGAAV